MTGDELHIRYSPIGGASYSPKGLEGEEGEGQTKLELVDSRTFSTGVLYLTYRPT
jgi:hypothetical protein